MQRNPTFVGQSLPALPTQTAQQLIFLMSLAHSLPIRVIPITIFPYDQ
jgi:hypothetical protein